MLVRNAKSAYFAALAYQRSRARQVKREANA